MQSNWAAENLQVIRTLMERSALYRRALAPIMLTVGAIGSLAGWVGSRLASDSYTIFVLFWLITGILSICVSFFLVRRQSLKDSEPFWSSPTRRVALALLPPLAAGFFLGASVLISERAERSWLIAPSLLLGLWMILYGCAIYSAGFFMTRGMRFLGLIFLFLGLKLLFTEWFELDFPSLLFGNISMGITFGGLHLAYGIYLYFTEKKKTVA